MTGPQINDHRYEGYPLAQKYAWMQQGEGPGGAFDPRFMLRKAADSLAQTDDNLRRAMRAAGLDWQGATADVAAGAIRRYADDMAATSTSGTQGAATVDQYGGSFAATKPRIGPPIEEGQNSFWGKALDSALGGGQEFAANVFDLQSDYHRRVVANRQADTAADEALYAHQSAAQTALAQFPTTDPVAGPPGGPGNTPTATPGGRAQAAPPGAGGRPASAGAGGRPASAGATPTHVGAPAESGAGTGAATSSSSPTGTPSASGGTTSGGTTAAAAPSTPPAPASGPGPGGSGVPAGGVPLGGGIVATPPPRIGASAATPGYVPGLIERALNGETGTNLAPRSGATPAERVPSAAPSGAGSRGPGSPAGPGGMAPMGGAGVGRPGGGTHKNKTFIPTDEPFRVDFDDVTPPVIGPPETSSATSPEPNGAPR